MVNRKGKITDIVLLFPALFISISVVLIPSIQTIYNSLTSWNGFAAEKTFIGFANYLEIFEDRYFHIAIKNNIIWMLLFLTIPVCVGMGMALLLLQRKRSRNFLQMIFLVPYVLAPVVTAMIFKNIIYSPTSGLIHFLNELNVGLDLKNPLTSREFGIIAVAAVDMWHFWSYLMIIYLAALRQTPADQLEAARLDGANFPQLFFHIYLPNIKPTVHLMSIMIVIFSFLAFDYVNLMTQGGPAHYTELLATLAYTSAFSERKIGMASAYSVIMSVFGLIAAFFYTKASMKEERD
ncbi:MAG: sugar ABC transporter permease [Oscillospiraceae bacterium]|nr:sugar ABC transporter permease [Oscillospiraceae bacterium]